MQGLSRDSKASSTMSDLNLAFAFTAGIIATINPCGFAMLPAYLSYFLGIEANSGTSAGTSVSRALWTGSAVSGGFLIIFGATGLLISAGLTVIREIVPWVAICIGTILIALGSFVTAGKRLNFAFPKFERGRGERICGICCFSVFLTQSPQFPAPCPPLLSWFRHRLPDLPLGSSLFSSMPVE